MQELKKVIGDLAEKLGITFDFYAESAPRKGVPVCDKSFEFVTDDGTHTFFRFLHKNIGYIGVLDGATAVEKNYALLLPFYIEGAEDKEAEFSKTDHLRKILLGECSTMGIYKYATKYSVRGVRCVAIVLRIPKHIKEAIALLEQYGGNSLDTVVQIGEQECVLVKFAEDEGEDYRSAVDYAEFLAQSLKEELGLDVQVGVGNTVHEIKDVSISYTSADNALRYADVFEINGNVHSYRDFILIKMIEDIPEMKRAEYLTQLTDEHFKEIFEDEEMLSTAETFLTSSLNVSETSRSLYMHRNTLLYRLDKIEKATGLNVRLFSDAVSFRVLTILYRLLKK